MTNKQTYYKDLRNRWKISKELAGKDKIALAMWRESGGNISYHGFFFVYQQLQALGLKGLPYVDVKTFDKWKKAGFTVKKDEKSKISGLVWKHPKVKDETGEYIEDTERLFPKVYHLFHLNQVEAIEKADDKLKVKEVKPANNSAKEINQPVVLF